LTRLLFRRRGRLVNQKLERRECPVVAAAAEGSSASGPSNSAPAVDSMQSEVAAKVKEKKREKKVRDPLDIIRQHLGKNEK
jgi:hypothetical protein